MGALTGSDDKNHTARWHANHADTVAELEEQRTRDRRRGRGPRRVQVCAASVRLTPRHPAFAPTGPARTLIASLTAGHAEPLVLLADRELTEPEEVLRYRRAYLARWGIETTIRQGKNRATGAASANAAGAAGPPGQHGTGGPPFQQPSPLSHRPPRRLQSPP